jgi:hypothetical protein
MIGLRELRNWSRPDVFAAVSRDERVWYPYATGSFGAEMML